MIVEQIVNAQKARIGALFELTGKTFEAVEQVIALNGSTARSAMAMTAQSIRLAMSAKDPRPWFALPANLFEPTSERTIAYGNKLYGIAASVAAEAMRIAEAQFAGARAEVDALVETAFLNAPAAIEGGFTLVRSTVIAAGNAIETAEESAKLAVEVAGTRFKAMILSRPLESVVPGGVAPEE